MPSFFDPAVSADLRRRIEGLGPESIARWGRMNVAQMMAHCSVGLKLPLGEIPVRTSWKTFIGRLIKKRVLGDKPWGQGVPTDPAFVVNEPKGFTEERGRLLALFDQLAQGPGAIRNRLHPFFGELSDEEWGQLTTKHLDHHLRQFGA